MNPVAGAADVSAGMAAWGRVHAQEPTGATAYVGKDRPATKHESPVTADRWTETMVASAVTRRPAARHGRAISRAVSPAGAGERRAP